MVGMIRTNTKISNFFTFKEATKTDTGLENEPNNNEAISIIYTACRMDLVRQVLNVPVIVNSWFRSKKVNEAVNGATLSQHRQGMAVDFRTNSLTPKQIIAKIKESGISYDQLIEYNTFVHISFVVVDSERRQYINKTK